MVICSFIIFSGIICQYQIQAIKLMKARVRQFNAARDRNLTETYTNASHNAVAGNPASNKPSFNQPSSSSFIKKVKSELCFNCVNKKLIKNKEQQKMNEEQMNLLEKRKIQQSLRQFRDPAQEYKQKMLAENNDYNKKIMKSKMQSVKSEKLLSSRINQELCQKQKKALEDQARRKEEQKIAQFKYRQQLIIQKHLQEVKKQEQKKERLQGEMNVLPLKNDDKTQMLKNYAMDLKVQMAQQAIRKQTQKQRKIRLEKQLIQRSNQDFQKKYTQFSNKSSRLSNPEIFQQIRSLEQARKNKKIKQRQANAKEREEMAKKLKELEDSNIRNNMKAAEQYAVELQKQVISKKKLQHSRKIDDLNYKWKEDKYTEDEPPKLKQCGQCKEKFQQKALTAFE